MPENTEKESMTTAEVLGKFRMELDAQRFNQELIEHLILKATDYLLENGLVVKA